MAPEATTTLQTRKNLNRGKILDRLYKALNEIEADIVTTLEQIHKYETWIMTGVDDTGRTLDGEDKACLVSLIFDLGDQIKADADLAWWLRKEIQALIDEAIAETNQLALSQSQGLRTAKSVHVSPK